MVNKPPAPDTISEMSWPHKTIGRIKKGRRSIEVKFPEYLFQQIQAEARQREWSFGHMVRHLCEASIEGIE